MHRPRGALRLLLTVVVLLAVLAPGARAQSDGDLATQLVNPITTLVRVPVELGYDKRIGPMDGGKV